MALCFFDIGPFSADGIYEGVCPSMNSQGGLKEKAIIGMGSCGLMVEIRTHNRKVASSSLGPAGIVGGGSKCTAISLHSIPRRGALEQGTEPPTAPWAPQHKWLPTAPGVCSQCLCVHCCVCALGWVNAEHEL